MKRVLIIAGGTGGHIFPALAIAETLQKQGFSIEWMGTEAGMEKKLVGDRYPMHFLPVKTFRGKNIFVKIAAPFRLTFSVLQAVFMIRKIKPTVVIGMGGYASGPGGIAAWLLRKRLIIHEQNAIAGLTNRLLSRFATTVLEAFPNAFSKTVRAITVGNPVRNTIKFKDYIVHEPLRILILGGSQGAQFINQLMIDFVAKTEDRKKVLIWHQTGQRDFERVKKAYAMLEDFPHRVAPFIDKMDDAYAWADLVIARSGALTVSEIAAVGLPSILIPYPFAADDHQYYNAQFLSAQKAAVVFRETEIIVEKLQDCLEGWMQSPEILKEMANAAKHALQNDAVVKICEFVMKTDQ